MKFDTWKAEVDRLFRDRYLTNWSDLCGDDGPLRIAFTEDDTPEQFTEWFAEKYNLVRIK